MWAWVIQSEVLVYLAGVSFVLGYVIINQVVLRLWVTLGTLLYILYYATAAETPLWGAIYMSLAMGTANLIGLGSLLWRRSAWAVPARHRKLYDRYFHHVPPGDFRTIMAAGRRYTTEAKEEIATHDVPARRVVFLVAGQAVVEKEGERFVMPAGWFFGEVSYVLNQPAAATAHVPAGTELVVWERAALDRLCRQPRLRLAFEAAVARDVARKVSFAVAPPSLRIPRETKHDATFGKARAG